MPLPPSILQRVMELAAIFGKTVLPYEQGFHVPKGKVGIWILDYDPKNDTFLIREIADTAGNFRYPFGDFSIEANEFYTSVAMMVKALNEYRKLYPSPPGIVQVTPGYGARVRTGQVAQTGGERWIRAYFSGNIATMQSSKAETYETTNQDNAMEALSFWILNGVLKPGAVPDREPKRPQRGEGNWLEIEKVNGTINIADNHNQNLSTQDAQKAIRAVKSWVYGGMLKG